ncbi:MAG: hypothetical protein HY093_00560 [Candidatus Liptonbacteria bacterium]|nr:hypothetical protein [Candidatus Liptonbacteria bacterium]
MKYRLLFGLAVLLWLWPWFGANLALADVATSTSFNLHSVIGTGGSRSTSTTFNEKGVLGQPGEGISSSTSFVLKGGFLYFGPAVTTTVATSGGPGPSGGGGPTGGGGGGLFFPGEQPLPKKTGKLRCGSLALDKVDLSGDCKVNLIDLSILLYYYERSGPGVAQYDFNENLTVDFPDISVMMFYWSG